MDKPNALLERKRIMCKLNRFQSSIGWVLVPALVAGLFAGAAQAQDFHDPDSIAWKFRYGLSDAAYSQAWKRR